MVKRKCPSCGSQRVVTKAGILTGVPPEMRCKKCGYVCSQREQAKLITWE